ncbi:insulinase family protein [Desulfosarcina sp. OttesenSCG-928-G10]|nr:insulinase family protein [Desulfosarcina sp. OttesenSCG-928-G10]MDL2320852.1 insulinase family protein [Desulfosarcina sp. OttesenSCG-928-B08]
MQTIEADRFNPGIQKSTRVGAHTVDTVTFLADIRAWLYQLTHTATGARHIHISTADPENTFGVAFKTVPEDSTGVAHILEHTVLCGSTRFPVRDPFFSMIKRSLSTFMNAFTASDWTLYPFSTQNRKDFYNLMDVYLDAAFFPAMDALSFKQEGHRLDFEGDGENRRLVYKGVVYNEMKGAMSSPDQVMGRALLAALYPDTTYRYNSGGDPAVIPLLTHDQLKAFHARHYHPSNAYFYTYGNLPLKDHLAFIEDRVLGRFDRIDPGTTVPRQPRWTASRTVSHAYPLDPSEDAAKKYQVSVAWLLSDIEDTFEMLVASVLEQILIGNAASPLRKALMDSGLGSALADATGFDGENRDTLFSVGLKDVGEADGPAIESLVLDVLEKLAGTGIDPDLVESAIHQIEFHRKEITNTPYPFGIKVLLGIVGNWLHGGDPRRILHLDADLERFRQCLADGGFLESRIRRYFLDNSHRVRLMLVPDTQMAEKERLRVEKELQGQLSCLDTAALAQIQKDAEALEHRQEAPENIDCLPTLSRADIPPTVTGLGIAIAGSASTGIWSSDQPTSGIFYFSGALGAGRIPLDLLPLVPFFCYTASKVGTAACDYIQMARRIDRHTGGVGFVPSVRTRFDGKGACLPFVALSGKCLTRNVDPLFSIIQELATQLVFSDLSRLRQLLLEYQAGLTSAVVHNGHRLAISLASRNFSQAARLQELWGGIHHLHKIKTLAGAVNDDNMEKLAADLRAIGQLLFCQDNAKWALVGETSALEPAGTAAIRLSEALAGAGENGFVPPAVTVPETLPAEGWSTSTAVSFVAQTFPVVRLEHPDSPALAVIAKMLRSLYLHREIREKGGAYGGFAIYNAEDGIFSFGSYRDPHIENTLQVYHNAADFICSGQYTESDVNEAILQVCSEMDKPDPPGPAARKAFFRRLIGLSDDMRLANKKNLLKLDKTAIVAAAKQYFTADRMTPAIAVISSQDRLEAANPNLGRIPGVRELNLRRI